MDSTVDSFGPMPEQFGLGQLKNVSTLTVMSSRDYSYSNYSHSCEGFINYICKKCQMRT